MADDFDQPAAGGQPSQIAVLDGHWFRRERERIAIGRPIVAAHLGVPLRRVAALEVKNEAIPTDWLLLLPALGFQQPQILPASPVGMSVQPSPPLTLLPAQDDAMLQKGASTLALPSAAQPLPMRPDITQGAQGVAQSGPMLQRDTPSAAPPLTPDTPLQESGAPQAPLPPAPRIPRGLWLRSRRIDLGHSLKMMSKALGVPAHDLGVLEWQNLVIPPAWMAALAAHRFCQGTPSPASPSALDGTPSGAWLRLERQRNGHTPEICAISLGVRPHFLELVELHDWPLTPEWLPVLAKLGFSTSGVPSSPIVPIAASAALPLSMESTLSSTAPNAGNGDRGRQPVLSLAADAAAPRLDRQEGKLRQVPMDKNPQISAQTIESRENAEQPVRPEQPPIVSTLGTPASPESVGAGLVNTPSPVRPSSTAAVSAARTADEHPQIRQSSVSGARTKKPVPTPLTGSWLRVHRHKRKLSQEQLAKKLKVTAWTVGSCERADRTVSPDWLPLLRKLGFPVPQPSADIAASQSTKRSPVTSAQDLRPSGGWLRAECKRLGLETLDLKKALGGVKTDSIRAVESDQGRVPDSWLSTLHALGFSLPSHLAGWNASDSEGTHKLRGAGLRKVRQRLKISEQRVQRAVGVHRLTLAAIEKYDRILPASWLPALRKLGLIASNEKAASNPPQQSQPERDPNSNPDPTGRPPASPSGAVEPSSPPAILSPEKREDLVAAIVQYHVHLGRSIGRPAFHVLGWITQDMHEAGLEGVITYELLLAALDALKVSLR